MEQSVPELQEYERKKIFSREEITSIAKKRSEFEHILNARGSNPSDYARYATYEMNLDALRKKRSRRMGVKATTYTGQKKIFFVLERGVRKFPGDMALWMQYIEFCKEEDANKKLGKALTQCLRLHPLRWELWVWAARYYVEAQADMNTGRSYMQRGLRFCKNERKMWLEYAKLEMIYVAKIAARRKILGLDEQRKQAAETDARLDADADMITLPSVTTEDINPSAKKDTEAVDQTALQNLASTPALSGAIPRTIFDAAMKHFNHDAILAEHFFDLFAEFDKVPCCIKLLQHITDHLAQMYDEQSKDRVSLYACNAKSELLGVESTSAEFPLKLGSALAVYKQAAAALPQYKVDIAEKAVLQLLPYLRLRDELDQAVLAVLNASVKQNLRVIAQAPTRVGVKDRLGAIAQRLQKEKKTQELKLLVEHGLKVQSDNQALMEIRISLG